MKLELNLSKKHLSIAFMFLGILIGTMIVLAYGGNEPTVMGHSSGEIDIATSLSGTIPLNQFESYLEGRLAIKCSYTSTTQTVFGGGYHELQYGCADPKSKLTGGGCQFTTVPANAQISTKRSEPYWSGSGYIWICGAESSANNFKIETSTICCKTS